MKYFNLLLQILHLSLSLLLIFLIVSCQKPVKLPSGESVLKEFQSPSSEFRSAPLWVWNSDLNEEEIETHLKELHSQGIGGVFIHPRPGLITSYLSEEWLDLCRFAVSKGKELGMKVWLYDENSYPSGFAGGHVPAEMPESVGKGLRLTRTEQIPESLPAELVIVLKKTPAGFENVTQNLKAASRDSGMYYVFDLEEARKSSWFGGFSYVDVMQKKVTKKFLDITIGAYKQAIGNEFGKTVPGIFTDEPHIRPVGGQDRTSWTPALFDEFQRTWGYDLKVHLPSLFEEVGNWQQVRHNYRQVLHNLFVAGWAQPYFEYCQKNHLQMTGHYWEHDWPRSHGVPDNMGMYAHMQMPGIDCLMNEFSYSPHAQFGNARAVKELSSVANQLGLPRTLCEAYGASGWDLTFEDQKRIGDWLYVLGVNFLDQHLSYITIKGARKRDHPLSFSYHEPYWQSYHIMADYFGRLTVALTSGTQVNKILVIEPTTSAWMYYSPNGSPDRLKEIGVEFQDFVHQLEKNQVEFDLGSEAIIKNHAQVVDGNFRIAKRDYDLVVLPPGLENLNSATADLIENYLAKGGKIISFVSPPAYIDGSASPRMAEWPKQWVAQWATVDTTFDVARLQNLVPTDINFVSPAGMGGLVFHHRRQIADGQLIFLINTDKDQGAAGEFSVSGQSVAEWDLQSGEAHPYPVTGVNGKLQIQFDLDPVGSLLLFVKNTGKLQTATKPATEDLRVKRSEGRMTMKRLAPNVLTLDYCDLKFENAVEEGLYFYDAQRKTFQRHGLEVNPWDHAVQYKTSIVEQDTFDAQSGFEAVFKFEVADGVALESFELVAERPELFQVSVNGNTVANEKDRYWLDRAFGVYHIGAFVTVGENQISIKSSPFTIHSELEPIYLLGDFSLESQAKGFKVVPSEKVKLGPWNTQGMPFYSDAVRYQMTYNLGLTPAAKKQYYVQLGDWLGAMAEVTVNNQLVGDVSWPPYRLDVTDKIKPGKNTVSIKVIGTLKNLLGPHHGNPAHGRAWPGMFRKGAEGGQPPGVQYDVIGYGLFEEFKLLESR